MYILNYLESSVAGHIVVTVLPPISTEGLSAADIPRLMEDTRARMVTTFNDTSSILKARVLADSEDKTM